MLLKYSLFLFLAACVFAALPKKCPEDSFPTLTNPDMCYTWTDYGTVDYPFATYINAENVCNQKGGHLASIPSAKENAYLMELIKKDKDGGAYWFGINNLERDGLWKWTDGSPVNYLNWAEGQPGDDCGVFSQYTLRWSSYICEAKLNYICLIPAV